MIVSFQYDRACDSCGDLGVATDEILCPVCKPQKRVARLAPRVHADGEIVIMHGARQLERGWIPMLVINGREHWNWTHTAFDLDVAQQLAAQQARAEVCRYSGDWKISTVAIETIDGREATP